VSPDNPTPPSAIQIRTLQYLRASLVVAVWVVAASVAGNVPLAILLGVISFVFLVAPALKAAIRPDEE
jgi:hypothetical protein